MKKWLFSICLLSVFLLAGCGNNISNNTQKWLSPYWTWMSVDEVHCKSHWWNVVRQEFPDWNYMSTCFFSDWSFCSTIDFYVWKCENPTETWVEIGQYVTLEDAIINYIEDNYSCDDQSKMFVNYAELWMKSLGNGMAERYIDAIGEWYYIDERWNLNNSCGFSIPMKVTTFSEDWANYVVTDVVLAKDWSEYTNSIKEMFSNEAAKKLFNEDYEFLDGRSLLEMAEEYFGITIVPETENNFECNFCDKIRYYNHTPEDDELLKETNELHYNYISENNWENTIYFGSDWTFKAEWKWDAWEWTRTFGQDKNTVIVLNNNLDHVYHRYIITNQTENSLNTILEIIQRR